MARTITVKGTGKYKASPDCAEIRLDLETVEKEYGSALENENGKIAKLTDAVISAGLKEEDLKTESFNVNTEYKSVETKSRRYESVFAGYRVSHSLVLRFDFDADKLSEVITAISCSGVQPGMNIGFTVKDKDAASEAMLKSAVENARRNAEVLCASSGVTLGDLLSIDYS
ncbi:MAG: SIMPL domain-containing protein, partial [Firmicutes bacterium]|nr:SIMPL domain-containing protein [Candidatus Colimorpha enterica]